MSTESLLAVSIGISTGLAVALMLMGVALLVVVTRSRAERAAVEELRIANEALAERLDHAIGEMQRIAQMIEGDR